MDKDQAHPQPAGDKPMKGREENPFLARKYLGWCGRFEVDEWYCRCGRLAKCVAVGNWRAQCFLFQCLKMNLRCVLSASQKPLNVAITDSPTTLDHARSSLRQKGDPRKEEDLQPCQFFLWGDEQEIAKKWMELNPTTPRKQPPKPREIRTPKSPKNNGSSKKMNDWLKLGSKRPINDISDGDVSEGKEEGKESDEDFVVVGNEEDKNVFGEENLCDISPSRKPSKVARFVSAGQPLNDRLQDDRNALPPTPVTGGRDGNRYFRGRNVSPIPIRLEAAIDLDDQEPLPEGKLDLINKILAVIKADYPDLKASTGIAIKHEIEEEACKLQAEIKVCRRTITRLRKEADDWEEKADDRRKEANDWEKEAHRLEKFVVDITAGSFADDPVVLSEDGGDA
ncbi:uncharacterized protein RSE6_13902 [Rhynchosporium secalis]|uniref:Uncharacterized protein n=1 Tax=Rhynchosporium secalis TaxID=38038 RepID=A0A1E1MUP7_RHYSE|nr:uncharacterized protein RSE6_13902 [Rhynchosporium secalis]